MTIRSNDELEGMKAAGRVVAEALAAMRREVRVGVTTAEIEAAAARVLRHHGARSAPRLVYGFPGDALISVNDEVVHGVPGERTIADGDVVKLDMTAEKGGYMADAACTVVVGGDGGLGRRLAAATRSAFRRGLARARAGGRVSHLGRAVEQEARRHGFRVVRELCGHGIGRTIHEPPQVPNYENVRSRTRLDLGAVITIEPLLSAGSGDVELAADGWTYRTRDGALAAHHEHTLVVTRGKPIVLTAAA